MRKPQGKRARALFVALLTIFAALSVFGAPAANAEAGLPIWTDVPDGAIYIADIDWAFEQGFVLGLADAGDNERLASPDRPLSRIEAVTILHRMAGSPAPTAAHTFTDTDEPGLEFGQDAVSWAVEEGVVLGRTGTEFAPRASITRAALVALLHRLAGSPAAGETTFPDMDDPSVAWARGHVAWAAENGITKGNGGMFLPMDVTNRAEMAIFARRFAPTLDIPTDVTPRAAVALDFTGLEPLGENAVYEGWLIIDGAPVSTGRFSIDDAGAVQPEGAQPTLINAAAATTVVVTIEPAVDPDPAPAATHVLAGDVAAGAATLAVNHAAALGTDFATAAGKYVLATPTTSDTTDEFSGVWFIDMDMGATQQGLTLPTLPAGWEYEGWAVLDGTPLSTGRFTDPGAADLAAPFSGTDGSGPPFPGEDFVANAPDGVTFPVDLRGATVEISVEPEPDDGPAPFAIKPLVATVPDGIDADVVQTMGAGPALPAGTATIG